MQSCPRSEFQLPDRFASLCTPPLLSETKDELLEKAVSLYRSKFTDCLAGPVRNNRPKLNLLESILQKHGANPRAHTDQAMQALVNETEMMLGMLNGNELRDAGLIASAQKLEHYEIAAYGTVAALAGQLDLRDDQQMLHESLEEEKQADLRLTKLAKREVNPDALAA
jgi:ferritin-like metal-binding protein YciE